MSERLEKLKFLIEKLPNVNESMNFLITELEETQKAFDELDGLYVDLQEQNERYRNLLESLSKTRNIPAKIMKEQPDKKIINANDLLQYILRKINDELGGSEMNLQPLFETQAKLDKRIVEKKGLQGQDLLDKKILALQVELGELANEWRGFKFWSENQKPNTEVIEGCKVCYGQSYEAEEHCDECGGGGAIKKHPLLEEYVDCLHFILSIGNELGESDVDNWFVDEDTELYKSKNIVEQFIYINGEITEIYQYDFSYKALVYRMLCLGEMLGFNWSEIEQSYYEKNKINHERQNNGY